MITNTLLAILSVLVATIHPAPPTAQQSFEALKHLQGEWRGKDSLGHEAVITFRVVSGGSAVLSELLEPNHQNPQDQEDMISMFHLDGDRLMLTHDCSAGNQPRMRASVSVDGTVITFRHVDATNLAAHHGAHMDRVTIRILAPDHHAEEWAFVDGKERSTDVFDLWRKS